MGDPLLVERVPIASVRKDEKNARKHSKKNLEAIKASLAEFGQQKSIVVDKDGKVIAGNGTLDAALALGWTEIDVVRTDLTGARAKAYAVADNRTAELAVWDDAMLAEALAAIETDEDLDSVCTGFTEAEIERAINKGTGAGAVDEDQAPEPPAEPVTKPGDIWILGEHRLLCGDSTKAEDVARVMAGEKAALAFTSPPYASQREYDESSGFKPIRPEEYVGWFCSVQSNVRAILAENGSWFVNIKEHCEEGQRDLYVKDLTIAHVRSWGWCFIDELCWKRNSIPGLFPGRFKNLWEPVFHFSPVVGTKVKCNQFAVAKEGDGFEYRPGLVKRLKSTGSDENGAELHERSAVLPGNVLEFNADSSKEQTGHTAPFPVALPAFFIRAYSDEGDSIYDPFLGSGTTLISCEQLNRRGRGIEISPRYCDVIVKRWENLTGGKATRA